MKSCRQNLRSNRTKAVHPVAFLIAAGWISSPLAAQVLKPTATFQDSQSIQSAAFGSEVVYESGMLVIGSGGASIDGGERQGLVYFYDEVSGELLFQLAPDDPFAFGFGNVIAVDPPLVVIGATNSRHNELNSAGAIYVYDLEQRAFRGSILLDQPHQSDYFGRSIAISGNRIVTGSPGISSTEQNTGGAYIYDATTLELVTELDPGHRGYGSGFGSSVALVGNLAYIGYHNYTSPIGWGRGAVFVFDASTGEVLDTIRLDGPIETPNGGHTCFGCSLAVDESLIVIGAVRSGQGAVFVYDTQTRTPLAELRPENRTVNDFGNKVLLSEDFIVVSAWGDSLGALRAGAEYVYDRDSFELVARLVASDPQPQERMGGSIAVVGGRIYSGAPTSDLNEDLQLTGRVFQFDASCPADFNGDSKIDTDDFYLFVNWFLAGDLRVDFNDDNILDVGDIGKFIERYNDGC